jgi:hypothetical protein
MESAGDVVGVADDLEDAHAAAALAAEGDVDSEDPGEEFGPADTAGSRRGRGRVVVVNAGEAEVSCCSGARTTQGGMMRVRR